MMRSTPKMSDSPEATSPYTPPSSRPLTPACRKRSVTAGGPRPGPPDPPRRLGTPRRSRGAPRLPSAVPPHDGENGLGLGEAGRTHDDGLAVLHLQQRGRGVHVLPG